MLLFIKNRDVPVNQYVIPLDKVFMIWVSGSSVNVNFDGGEYLEVEGSFQKKLEIVSVKFSSAENANKALRQFYKAVNADAKAFFLGADL